MMDEHPNRLAVILNIIIAFLLSACGVFAQDQSLTTEELALPLTSLLVRAHDVFAANDSGIYRSIQTDQRWQRLPSPVAKPSFGAFAVTPTPSKDIWYYTRVPYDNQNPGKYRCPLYRSTDNGQHWQLVTDQHFFHFLFLHPNGTLYGLVRNYMTTTSKDGDKPVISWNDHIIRSTDAGKSWLDITGNAAMPDLINIFLDPQHPEQVCILGNSIRTYVIHSLDAQFNWQKTREWEWNITPMTDDRFFQDYYSTQSILYTLTATLANYFSHPFGDHTHLPGFRLATGHDEYTFAQADTKPVQVTVSFLPADTTVKLLDRSDAGFWGLRIKTPDGEYPSVETPIWKAIKDLKDRTEAGKDIGEAPDVTEHQINNRQPYMRILDLGKMYNFSKKGKYRVQLYYFSTEIADREQGQWPGEFTGNIFTVIIN